MKKELKGFVCGMLTTALLTCGVTFAAGQWKQIDVLENDIRVIVDGKEVTESNFVYNDRTYLPLRAVAEAVNKPVEYDEATNTAYIGSKEKPATQVQTTNSTSSTTSTKTTEKSGISDAEYKERKAELDELRSDALDELDAILEDGLDEIDERRDSYDTSELDEILDELEREADKYEGAATLEGKRKYESILDDIEYVEEQIEQVDKLLSKLDDQEDELLEQYEQLKAEIEETYQSELDKLNAMR